MQCKSLLKYYKNKISISFQKGNDNETMDSFVFLKLKRASTKSVL